VQVSKECTSVQIMGETADELLKGGGLGFGGPKSARKNNHRRQGEKYGFEPKTAKVPVAPRLKQIVVAIEQGEGAERLGRRKKNVERHCWRTQNRKKSFG